MRNGHFCYGVIEGIQRQEVWADMVVKKDSLKTRIRVNLDTSEGHGTEKT